MNNNDTTQQQEGCVVDVGLIETGVCRRTKKVTHSPVPSDSAIGECLVGITESPEDGELPVFSFKMEPPRMPGANSHHLQSGVGRVSGRWRLKAPLVSYCFVSFLKGKSRPRKDKMRVANRSGRRDETKQNPFYSKRRAFESLHPFEFETRVFRKSSDTRRIFLGEVAKKSKRKRKSRKINSKANRL